MKDDIYFKELLDDKYMTSYQCFEIQNMNPRNHFFFKALMNDAIRQSCEKHVDFYQLWYLTEKDDDKVYHINSIGYKGGALKRRDEVVVGCFLKKDEDTYIHVYKSVNNKKFPELENSDRLSVMKGGFVYRRNLDKEGLSWQVSGLRVCNRFTRP